MTGIKVHNDIAQFWNIQLCYRTIGSIRSIVLLSSIAIVSFTMNSCGLGFAEEQYAIPNSLTNHSQEFKDYWFAGIAEICEYDLTQARYGELRKGSATLVFVTESYSKAEHLKIDGIVDEPDDKVEVFKLNFTKNFVTGTYPYHMMTSVFTPIDRYKFPNSFRITNTCQEWCGQTFTRIDLDEKINYQLYSYFPDEGEQEFTFEPVYTEDEIWNLIRIEPDALPTGEFEIIEGTMYQRLSRHTPSVQPVHGELRPADNGVREYQLTYEDRELVILFEDVFPYTILEWSEIYKDGTKDDSPVLTTTAVLSSVTQQDFWNYKSVDDE